MSPSSGQQPGHKRWWLWWPLLAMGAWLVLFGDKTPASEAEISLPTRSAQPQVAAAAPAIEAEAGSLVPLVPREQLISSPPARDTRSINAPEIGARDLFSARTWNPPPPPPPPVLSAARVTPTLPYSYIGKKLEGETWEVYLTRGDRLFVAREGQVLEGSYRVDKVAPPTLYFTYLPLEQEQTLSIGDLR